MIWTLNESLNDIKRDHLRRAGCLNIIRDERHSRMHIRYRCIGAHETLPNIGYFGQCRENDPSSLGIIDGTVKVYKEVCTSRANPPKGASLSCGPSCIFDESLFNHCKNITEACSTDSAENEVVATRDMRRPELFPNCSFQLRDMVHSSRRVLSRLWKASPRLNHCYEFFGLIASIIQWSDDLRRLYSECTEQSSDAAVSTKFQHLRAAKHRIETHLTPMSRCCLDPSGERSL